MIDEGSKPAADTTYLGTIFFTLLHGLFFLSSLQYVVFGSLGCIFVSFAESIPSTLATSRNLDADLGTGVGLGGSQSLPSSLQSEGQKEEKKISQSSQVSPKKASWESPLDRRIPRSWRPCPQLQLRKWGGCGVEGIHSRFFRIFLFRLLLLSLSLPASYRRREESFTFV